MSNTFSMSFSGADLTLSQDLFQITNSSSNLVEVKEIVISTDTAALSPTRQRIGLYRAHGALNGQGGAITSPQPSESGEAPSCLQYASVNSLTTGSGALSTDLWLVDSWDSKSGWYYNPDRVDRIKLGLGDSLLVRLITGSPNTKANGTIVWEERLGSLAPNRVFYVDSVAGNDSNSGTNISYPWQTLGKINNSTFIPGDTISLKRNSFFNQTLYMPSSGSSGRPITFTSYGGGNPPIINAKSHAIDGQGISYININNVQINNTSDYAVNLQNGCTDWSFNNLGFLNSNGGIFVWFSHRITIANCYVSGGGNEGFWMWKGSGLSITNSIAENMQGPQCDCVQLTNVNNASISNCKFHINHDGTGKGNIIAEGGGPLAIFNNILSNGNYGCGMAQGSTTIYNNHFINNSNPTYTWSCGTMFDPSGTNVDAQNVTICSNLYDTPNMGVYIWGSGVRKNFRVENNVIQNNAATGVYIISTLTSSLVTNNQIWHTADGPPQPASPLTGNIGPVGPIGPT
jgi:hypothetical protein